MQNIFYILISVLCDIFSAFTIATLWEWFVVPFSGAIPKLTVLHVAGLLILYSLLRKKNKDIIEDASTEQLVKLIIHTCLMNIISLITGYIYWKFSH